MLVTAEVNDQKGLVIIDERKAINVEATGIELPQTEDFSFAIWFALPLAMRAGSNLHIDCPVDPVVVRNAEEMSRIWAMWQPHRFAPVKITAPTAAPRVTPVHSENFMFFSGGADSAFAMLERGVRVPSAFAVTVRNPAPHQGSKQHSQRTSRKLHPS